VLIRHKLDYDCVFHAFLHPCLNLHKYAVICVVVRQDWVEGVHTRIATAIKNARVNRSAQWLADETERLGYPISRATIANYESGRKKGLDIAELLVLAAALQIPPLAILFPQLPNGTIEVLPGMETTSWNAAAWFSGEANSPDPTRDPWPTSKQYELLRAVRERHNQLVAFPQFYDYMRRTLEQKRVLRHGDPDMRAFKEQLLTLQQELKRLEDVIRENGGVIDDG
jgi:transcriptional regulator with XRE-family HTH domain